MPIDTQLIAVATHGPRPLAGYLAGPDGGAPGATGAPGPIVVPVQGAESAGIDSYLGAPAADVIARCEATGGAGDLTSAVIGAGAVILPEVEIGDQTGLLTPEFGSQEVPEQAMVAVPLTAAVEREYQQVPGFHLLEDGSGSLLLQDRVAQRSAHPVEDRRAGEE